MNFRKIVALCLVPVLIILAFSAAAEGVEELPGIQMIIENFMAHAYPSGGAVSTVSLSRG